MTNQRHASTTVLATLFSAMLFHCNADTFTTVPIADAFVATGTSSDNLSGDNFGRAGSLTVEAGNLSLGGFQSVLEFNLSSAQSYFNSEYGAGAWSVQAVSLVLTASPHPNSIFNAPAAGQFGISLMQNNSWVEGIGTGGAPTTDGISYNSLTGTYINNATDQALGIFSFAGGTSGTATYGLRLTSGVVGDLAGGSDLSLRLFPNDTSVSYLFNSRTASSSVPELEITATPEPGTLALDLSGLAALLLWRCTKRSQEAA